jgi:hypothetical protein
MQGFDIYFLGEMLPEANPTDVREGVARIFKIDPAAADRLFSGKPLRVKQAVDAEAASRYRAAFRDVGALLQIVPEGSAPPAVAAPAAAAGQTVPGIAAAELSAAGPEASEGPDGLTLAEPGATIDHTPPPPPADIDTSRLEALPANTGSLEDCTTEKPVRVIPDISHMKLVDD